MDINTVLWLMSNGSLVAEIWLFQDQDSRYIHVSAFISRYFEVYLGIRRYHRYYVYLKVSRYQKVLHVFIGMQGISRYITIRMY